jgi:hypothetical protein
MARSLSAALTVAMLSSETGECPLVLLTIQHHSLPDAVRLSSDFDNTLSRGVIFVAYPFDLVLPDDQEETSPRARLQVDNVAREIVALARAGGDPPTVLMEIIRASAPDVVEASFGPFNFAGPEWDDMFVSTDLELKDTGQEPYPYQRYTPDLFFGLFRQLA